MSMRRTLWALLFLLALAAVGGLVYASVQGDLFHGPLTGEFLPCPECCPLNGERTQESFICPVTGEELPCPECCPFTNP